MYNYRLLYQNGEACSIAIKEFKDITEAYVRERITEHIKYPVIIRQRCYKNGRWTFKIYTMLRPYTKGYHKDYYFIWDYYDIKGLLDKVIEDYEEWISSVE